MGELLVRYSRPDREAGVIWDVYAYRDITTEEAETAIAVYRSSPQGRSPAPGNRIGVITTIGVADD